MKATHLNPIPEHPSQYRWALRLGIRNFCRFPRSHASSLPWLALIGFVLLAASARAEDWFPTLRVENTVLTNVHIVEVTPAEVLLSADGPVFKRIKRQDLPDGLKDKYPYDPAQIEAYKREQERKAKELREQQRNETYAALLRRERETAAQIDRKAADLARVQRDINNWRARPKGYGKLAMLHQLQETKLGLLREVDYLRQQLGQTRQALAQYR